VLAAISRACAFRRSLFQDDDAVELPDAVGTDLLGLMVFGRIAGVAGEHNHGQPYHFDGHLSVAERVCRGKRTSVKDRSARLKMVSLIRPLDHTRLRSRAIIAA